MKILIWDVYGSRPLRVRVWKKFSIIYTLYIFLESSQRAEHIGKIRNDLSFLFRKIFKKIIFWFFKILTWDIYGSRPLGVRVWKKF